MADCPTAVILSAVLLSVGFSVFKSPVQTEDSKSGNHRHHALATFTFLTAVFAWVSAHNLNIFFCRLSSFSLFFYEFFASLFVMETALLVFWRPLETFLSSTLPSLLEKVLLKDAVGGCTLYGLFCAGHTFVYSVLVHVMAFNVLLCVLFGFGVIQEPILEL